MRRRSILALFFALAACTGGVGEGPGDAVDRPAAATVDVVVAPASLVMAAGGKVEFVATVTGVADASVAWSVAEGSAGGSIDASGSYVAPLTPGTYHVIATSKADGARSGSATVTVTSEAPAAAAAVTIAPTGIVLVAGGQQSFTCAVTGVADTACTFSIQEGATGGRIDQAGGYVAPTTPGTYHVVATSHADAATSATASVIVTASAAAQVVAVAISPTSVGLLSGGSQAFTCTVTGSTDTGCSFTVQEGASGGSIDATGRYTAGGVPGTYHVVAASHADPSRSTAATVVVTGAPAAAGVTIAPTTVSLLTGGSQAFSCAVTGSTDTSCTWSVQEGASGGAVDASGRYTAPSVAGTYHVVATSHANPAKTATSTVAVSAPPTPVSVTVTPASASVAACQTLTLSAVVSGSTNQGVAWSVQEGSGGGSVSPQGVYTAPSTAGTYHAIATSQADGTKSASAAIVVSDKVVSVSVSPANVSVQPGQTVQFTATVNTTCGSFASATLVTP